MDDAQELMFLCWEGGLEAEGGWDGTLATSEARLLRELQRLVEPHLEGESSSGRAARRPGSAQTLPALPGPPFQQVAAGFSA